MNGQNLHSIQTSSGFQTAFYSICKNSSFVEGQSNGAWSTSFVLFFKNYTLLDTDVCHEGLWMWKKELNNVDILLKFIRLKVVVSLRNISATFVSKLHIHVTVHRNRFLLNNQPDALIIQIYCVIKIYTFRASSLPIIRSSILTLLGSGHQKPAWNLPVPNVQ
jgi:hypothetical protein